MNVWVSCYKPKGSLVYYIQVRHKESGKILATRSTGKKRKRDADRVTPGLVEEILDGDREQMEILTFSEFCDRYEREELSTQRKSTQDNMQSIIRRIKRQMKPSLVKNITAAKCSAFRASLIEEGLSLYSVKRNLSGLRKLLNWAQQMGYIESVPHIKVPQKKDLVRTKGRAISTEEFERILSKVEQEVGSKRAPFWESDLRKLWVSGLRLDEAGRLDWTEGDFRVDLSGVHPRFLIASTGQKNKKAMRHPMTPDFFELLMKTPESERVGPVFKFVAVDTSKRLTAHTAGKVIAAIGKLAGVKAGKGRGGVQRYASSHDYRRSFGTRWSRIVEPEELRRLMRHVSLEITLEFYVDGIDDDLAEDVWQHATDSQKASLQEYAKNHANDS
ncbi:MAG: site-specific integrase [Planctomycetaceae bacterium]|nr:site-specific integrase [Planctomycetaceae bacterium]